MNFKVIISTDVCSLMGRLFHNLGAQTVNALLNALYFAYNTMVTCSLSFDLKPAQIPEFIWLLWINKFFKYVGTLLSFKHLCTIVKILYSILATIGNQCSSCKHFNELHHFFTFSTILAVQFWTLYILLRKYSCILNKLPFT